MHNSYSISTSKVCPKCGISKPLDEFWKLKSAKDGRQRYCIACLKAYSQEPSVKAHKREYHRKYMREYYKDLTPEQKRHKADYMREYMREYNQPKRMSAHNAVRQMIQSGQIPHPNFTTCWDCGKQAQHYHHPDYDKPNAVVALCAVCHAARHT